MTWRFAYASAAAAALLAGATARAAERPAIFTFDQPGQPLASALLALSEHTGAVVLAPAPLVARRAAPALRGTMTLSSALSSLLAGSRLTFAIGRDGVVTIVPLPVQGALPIPSASSADRTNSAPAEVAEIRVTAMERDQPGYLKRRSPSPIDILTEDEIARSGAATLGDAMAALPGVAAVSDGGETRQIALRGVASRFTRVRINGMETLATFGGANVGGGTNRGRAFDYNVFAADLFRQIRVQKTATADIDEGSLGATVDIRTRSAFDLRDGSVLLYGEQTWNSRADRLAPRSSIVLSRRLADDRLGVLVSAAYSRRYVVDAGSTAGGWQTGEALYPGFGATRGRAGLAEVNAALHARIPRLELMTADQSRLGLTAALDWRPSDRTRVSLDLLYATLRATRHEYLLESFTFRTAGPCGQATPPACGLNAVTAVDPVLRTGRGPSVLIAGTFDDVDVKSEARYDELDTIFRQVTLAATRQLPHGVQASALLGFSRSDFSNPVQNTLHLDQYDVDGFAYDFRDASRPYVGYGGAILDRPSAWTLSEVRDDPNWVDNSYKTAGLDLKGAWRGVEWRAGALHKDYRTGSVSLSRSNGTSANLNGLIPAALAAVPVANYVRLVGDDVSFGAANPPGQWLAPDVGRGLELFRQACARTGCAAFRLGPEPVAATNYAIGERDDAAYVLLSRPRASGRALWGDVGLRLARTAQDARGSQIQKDGSLKPVRDRRRYVDLLPSANLVWEPAEDLTVRLGAARVMVRPDLRSLRPGFTISTPSLKSVSAGDPDLTPTRATTVDLGLEWYAANGGAVTIAAYHKAIASVIQQTYTTPAPFSANPYGLPDSVAAEACGATPGCDPALPIWQFVRPANTGRGRLTGVEISAMTPLGAPGSALARFRLQGSGAYSRSKVRYELPGGRSDDVEDSLGGPRLVGNLALNYDGPRLDARLGVTYRGRYLGNVPAVTGGDAEGFSALTTLDASLRYRLSRALTLTADLTNLTDAVARQFIDRSGIANYQHRTGSDLRLGLRFRYR